MLKRTLAIAFALSLVLVAAPAGPLSASDTAHASSFCTFSPDDPKDAVDAAQCTAETTIDCIEYTLAGQPCPR